MKNAKERYPQGSRIYVEYISDDSYPNAVGHYGTVRFVDDAEQIHLVMDDGHVATVCKAYGDKFYRVMPDCNE